MLLSHSFRGHWVGGWHGGTYVYDPVPLCEVSYGWVDRAQHNILAITLTPLISFPPRLLYFLQSPLNLLCSVLFGRVFCASQRIMQVVQSLAMTRYVMYESITWWWLVAAPAGEWVWLGGWCGAWVIVCKLGVRSAGERRRGERERERKWIEMRFRLNRWWLDFISFSNVYLRILHKW